MSKFLSGAGAAVRLDNQPDGNPAPSAVSGAASTCTTSLWGDSRTWLVRRVLLVCWDALGWAAALLAAAFLRAEFVFEGLASRAGPAFLIAIGIQLGIGGLLQTYRGRHGVGSMDEAINVTGVIALSGSMLFLINILHAAPLVARSVPLVAVADRGAARGGHRWPCGCGANTATAGLQRSPPSDHLRRGSGRSADAVADAVRPGRRLPAGAMLDDNRCTGVAGSPVAVCGTRADIAGCVGLLGRHAGHRRPLAASQRGRRGRGGRGDAGLAVHTSRGSPTCCGRSRCRRWCPRPATR